MSRQLSVVLGLAALALACLFVLSRTDAPTADASTTAMELRVAAPGASCDDPQTPTTCDVYMGFPFTLYVDLAKAPLEGYISFQTEIDYGGLTYHPTAAVATEIVWPDAQGLKLRSPPSPTGSEGLVNHAASSGLVPPMPVSTFAGSLLAIELECPSLASDTIELVPYEAGNTNASSVRPPSLGPIAAADSLAVNCLPLPGELYLDGDLGGSPPTVLAGEHVRWTCEPGEPHYHWLSLQYTWGDIITGYIPPPFSFTQDPSPALEGVECWHAGSGFLVGLVFLNWAAPTDIRGTVVDAVSGMPAPSSVTLQKFVSGSWVNVTNPAEMAPAINPEAGTLTGGFGWDVGAGPQYRVSASSFSCTSYTSGALTLPATNIQISLTCMDSDADGLPDFIEPITIYDNFTTQYITQPDDPDTDGDTIPDGDDDCDGDSFSNVVELRDYRSDPCDWEAGDGDGDGCTDMEELRADEELGGRRDGRNPWDFFDTDGNKLIDLFTDVFGVANAFGLTPPDTGYSPILDRSAAPPGGDPWDLGAPDGTIDLFTDIFGVAFQFGHSCEAAP